MIRIGSRSTGRPTLNEVARLAAVSPITASRALRGVTTVAPELAEKVRAAAQTLGYVANSAARALASSCSQTVVVLVPSLSNPLFIETLEAIQDVLRIRGLDVVIGNYHYSPDEEEKLLRNHLVNRPRGILLTGFDHTAASRQMLETSGVPCVHMMELDTRLGTYCVGFSQQQAGAEAARHLLGRGRRVADWLTWPLSSTLAYCSAGPGFAKCWRTPGCSTPSCRSRRLSRPRLAWVVSCLPACWSNIRMSTEFSSAMTTSRRALPLRLCVWASPFPNAYRWWASMTCPVLPTWCRA
ncbi:Gluconate utilization system transcriptional regulator GntR [Pseudomonas savastanoi]|uniref:Gluconate utilization system transcriptional regulator GntR n=1 Tax=Pseudomonas savastanoi TaxID=29438 RepID=A0A3M5ZMS5_PSESS|nr:Gluconate utilization system transcriptional regulator GntR [Pseudomonas savastanoi]